MIRAIVGANWGDEGKGKITDIFAEDSDIVIRFQGGANAGHTIINDYGRFALHILPSGSFRQDVVNIIGSGVALNIEALLNEIESVVAAGVPRPTLYISDRAQVLMPYHVRFDELEEERLKGASFGSTKSGIAPFYGDKFLKIGIQVCMLYDEELLRNRLEKALAQKNVLLKHLYNQPEIEIEPLMAKLLELAEKIKPMVIDANAYLQNAIRENKRILLEGQLGTLRDPDNGIYPYTTSSSPLAGNGTVTCGLPINAYSDIFAITKAYSSCVGAGPFTTELFGDEAEELRKRGGDKGEYGATTHRPRRVGWFDAVATKYGCITQGATECIVTNIDVLGYLKEIPVCVAYDIDGEQVTDFPSTPRLMRAKPVYKVLPGWLEDIRGIKDYNKLPENCKKYIEEIEKLIGVPIRIVSNGPKRSELIYR